MADKRAELADLFRELAELTTLDEQSSQSFRVRAYENAVQAIRNLPADFAKLSVSELVKRHSIGKSTAEKIHEFLKTGTLEKITGLREKFPPPIVELSRISGIGPKTVGKLREIGVPVLYGEAGNSEILNHAALGRARALVITLPDDAAALAVVMTARKQAPDVHIVARASTWDGARQLRLQGVKQVVRPELEGGIEIVRRTLLDLDMPLREVQRYTELVRREGLDEAERPSVERARMLEDLHDAMKDVEVGWVSIESSSPLAGQSLATARLRQRAGVSVVAIKRAGAVIANPGPDDTLAPGDQVAVIGTPAKIREVHRSFETPSD
jgi:Trk K+ transport system NAD-binding subunit